MGSIRLKVGDRWVELVTEDRLDLTDDPESAAWYSWSGHLRAAELVRYHLTMDDAEKKAR